MDKELFRLQGIRPVMLLLAGLSLLQSVAIIGQALFLARTIAILFEGQTVQMAYQPLALFFVLIVARHTIVWLQRKSLAVLQKLPVSLCKGAFYPDCSSVVHVLQPVKEAESLLRLFWKG